MRIVYNIAGLYRPSGMEKILSDKANWLAGHGYEVTVITTEQKGRPDAFPLDSRIARRDLGIGYEDNNGASLWNKLIHYPLKQYRHRKRLTEALMEIRPDITVSMFCNEQGFLPAIKDGSRKVLELHFSRLKRLQYGRKGIWGLVDRIRSANETRQAKRFDRFVTLTEEDRRMWGDIPGICSIPNGIRLQDVVPGGHGENTVIAVGRYMYQKGLDRLIDAWKIVSDGLGPGHGWELHLLGEGELRTSLQEQIDRLGLSGSVRLRGNVEDMPGEYRNAAILALSSHYEGLPMALIEAQAYGLPAVSFDCKCGPREVIADGRTGLLVPEGDVEALARALLDLIRDPEGRRRMGAEAARMASRFDFEAIMKRWDELFKTV
ncbi:MAG: glycosyltransferase family 4 protein [Bacteroidales bacterium]|nr:glycosyltransferase family 4 protein [Bacteroidales bacterium]